MRDENVGSANSCSFGMLLALCRFRCDVCYCVTATNKVVTRGQCHYRSLNVTVNVGVTVKVHVSIKVNVAVN